MKFLDLAKMRYSVRRYTSQKVEKEKLEMILEAGRIAPTACNDQPQRLIVVQSEEHLRKLTRYNAPLAIIVCIDTTEVWERPYDKKKSTDVDASIITDHMMLQATELGLGSIWLHDFTPATIKKEFSLPDDFEPVNILAIGYADGSPASPNRHEKMRKPLEETVYLEV